MGVILSQARLSTTTKQYVFATILNPRHNISIRRTAREIRREIIAWIVAAGCLVLMAYVIAYTAIAAMKRN
jgi:hypothetical protein